MVFLIFYFWYNKKEKGFDMKEFDKLSQIVKLVLIFSLVGLFQVFTVLLKVHE